MKTGQGVARKMIELVCTGSQLVFWAMSTTSRLKSSNLFGEWIRFSLQKGRREG